jgi:nucleoid-associated protein YgaU
MSILDFIKDAGEKLVEKGQEAALAQKIHEKINAHGIKVNDLNVDVKDDQVFLKGSPMSHEDREKALLIAGNVKGIAKVNDTLVVKGEGGKTRFHTVVAGDTLSAISKKFYGDANKYNKIFEANKPMLSHPDKIYPGQVLRIPE